MEWKIKEEFQYGVLLSICKQNYSLNSTKLILLEHAECLTGVFKCISLFDCVNQQYLLEKVHVVLLCHRLLCLQRTYRTVVHTNIKILDFLTYNLFRTKYLRQPFINFDFCNLSSSGDIVYKDRWWHWHKLRYTDSDYLFGISGDVVYKERWWPWHKLRFTDSDYPFGISGDVVYKERWWHWHKLRFTDSDYPFGICGDIVYKERWWHWHKLRYTDSDYPFGISGDVAYKERWWPWHKLRYTQILITPLVSPVS
jgi:hypothetical protein